MPTAFSSQASHFAESGTSPPLRTRYRLRLATVTVARECSAAPPWRGKLDSPGRAAEVARALIPDDDREHFGLFALDNQNKLLAYHEVSVGSVSASLVHPVNVFRPALLLGAVGLVLLHNHPSGEVEPSREDVRLTQQLAQGARLLGLTLHDHVILGSGTGAFTSLAQRGLL